VFARVRINKIIGCSLCFFKARLIFENGLRGRVTGRFGKKCPNFGKVTQTLAIFIKAQFEIPKHVH